MPKPKKSLPYSKKANPPKRSKPASTGDSVPKKFKPKSKPDTWTGPDKPTSYPKKPRGAEPGPGDAPAYKPRYPKADGTKPPRKFSDREGGFKPRRDFGNDAGSDRPNQEPNEAGRGYRQNDDRPASPYRRNAEGRPAYGKPRPEGAPSGEGRRIGPGRDADRGPRKFDDNRQSPPSRPGRPRKEGTSYGQEAGDRAPSPERKRPVRPKVSESVASEDITPRVPEAIEVENFEVEQENVVTFFELGLSEIIAKTVAKLGFESPTPIQAQAIPVLNEGHDLIGNAQTGTGKTAAFGLPLIQRIDLSNRETQALVLAPTRELAIQVAGGLHEFGKDLGIRVVPVYGGQPIDRQFRSLKGGAQVVVGTPGRVLDHLRRGSLSIANVSYCVLDEADEMMALGFTEDLDAILGQLPESRQLVFFSATMPPRILALTSKFLRNPVHVTIQSRQRTVDTTNQTYYEVPQGKKLEALARVLDMETPGPTIVFCRTRQETNDLSDSLRLRGYNTEALHGDMTQQERDRVMRRFRDGQADLLIATDVAARGLDIETVTHVINYDIPWDVEQYIHRIGRTGRAGRSGDAITLVSGRERVKLKNIERMIGSPIKLARIPTSADIATKRKEDFIDSIRTVLQTEDYENQLPTVEDLAEEFEPSVIAAAALQMLWQSQHAAQVPVEDEIVYDFEQPELGMARLFVAMGRMDGLRPGDLVGAISNEAGLSGKTIGVIDVLDRVSYVEVPAAQAETVVEALRASGLRNKKVKVQIARAASAQANEGPPPRSRERRPTPSRRG